MNRSRPSSAILIPAALIVFGCLAALVVIPLINSSHAEELRRQNEKQVDPTRSLNGHVGARGKLLPARLMGPTWSYLVERTGS